jgi:hypothetical protein
MFIHGPVYPLISGGIPLWRPGVAPRGRVVLLTVHGCCELVDGEFYGGPVASYIERDCLAVWWEDGFQEGIGSCGHYHYLLLLISFWIFFSVSLDFGFASGLGGWHLSGTGNPEVVVSE